MILGQMSQDVAGSGWRGGKGQPRPSLGGGWSVGAVRATLQRRLSIAKPRPSRRSTNNSLASPAIASALRLWPSSTATSPKRSPAPMKFSVSRLPSEAPVSMRIWPRRTPNKDRRDRLSGTRPLRMPDAGCGKDVSSSGPKSAFILRMTANSACLLIALTLSVRARISNKFLRVP
jgi:hypothetical protein